MLHVSLNINVQMIYSSLKTIKYLDVRYSMMCNKITYYNSTYDKINVYF